MILWTFNLTLNAALFHCRKYLTWDSEDMLGVLICNAFNSNKINVKHFSIICHLMWETTNYTNATIFTLDFIVKLPNKCTYIKRNIRIYVGPKVPSKWFRKTFRKVVEFRGEGLILCLHFSLSSRNWIKLHYDNDGGRGSVLWLMTADKVGRFVWL